MTFRRSDLQEAFFVPGTQPFRVYGYGTTDPLEEVLRQDYFAAARALLCPGELKRGGTRAKAVEASGRDRGISGIADDFSGTSVNYLAAGACTNRDTLCTNWRHT
jgi:hypothetical protein